MNEESTISGYAAVFYRPGNKETEADIGGEFIERIKPGAFAKALRQGGSIASYTNHDPNFLLAREGTIPLSLLLHEDSVGLHVRIFPFATAAGRDALEMVRVGGLRGCSFGFSMVAGGRDTWHVEDGRQIRTIDEIGQLFDASPVVHPAYRGTSCQIDPARRDVAARLAQYEEKARRMTAPGTDKKGSTMIEMADDRSRGAKRSELQLQTRLRLYDRISRLRCEQSTLAAGAQRSVEIDRELATLAIETRDLENCAAGRMLEKVETRDHAAVLRSMEAQMLARRETLLDGLNLLPAAERAQREAANASEMAYLDRALANLSPHMDRNR